VQEMKFVSRKQRRLSLGGSYKDTVVNVYRTEDGVIYQQMGLAWFDANGTRLIGDISHLSKAADDLNVSLQER
jgi:hypothetical protein